MKLFPRCVGAGVIGPLCLHSPPCSSQSGDIRCQGERGGGRHLRRSSHHRPRGEPRDHHHQGECHHPGQWPGSGVTDCVLPPGMKVTVPAPQLSSPAASPARLDSADRDRALTQRHRGQGEGARMSGSEMSSDDHMIMGAQVVSVSGVVIALLARFQVL